MTTLKQKLVRRRFRRRTPFATIAALLTASGLTLIGVASGIDPYIILVRSLIGSLLIGALVGFGLTMVQLTNLEPQPRPISKGIPKTPERGNRSSG